MSATLLGLTASQFGFLLTGAGWTLLLSAAGIGGGALLAAPLSLVLGSRSVALRLPGTLLVQAVQGIPVPVLLFLTYFGLGIAGWDVSPGPSAGITLAIYAAAYLGEIWAGALAAVPREQREAGLALALRPSQVLLAVLLPQATRIATAPSVGFSVQLVKNTSYAVVIGVAELTYSARIVNNTTFEPFVIFTLAGALYFGLCYPLSLLGSRFERRHAPGYGNGHALQPPSAA